MFFQLKDCVKFPRESNVNSNMEWICILKACGDGQAKWTESVKMTETQQGPHKN